MKEQNYGWKEIPDTFICEDENILFSFTTLKEYKEEWHFPYWQVTFSDVLFTPKAISDLVNFSKGDCYLTLYIRTILRRREDGSDEEVCWKFENCRLINYNSTGVQSDGEPCVHEFVFQGEEKVLLKNYEAPRVDLSSHFVSWPDKNYMQKEKIEKKEKKIEKLQKEIDRIRLEN